MDQPCDHWLSFFCFTMFADRDGKFQLAALRESALDPLARSCEFMLTEEAFHLFVGETGMERIIRRAAELAAIDPDGDVRRQGGIDFGTLQRPINYWFSYCLDLFGSELSNNAAGYFGAGLKGRFKEADRYSDHQALTQHYTLAGVEDGRLVEREVPLRSAINEVLRDDYITIGVVHCEHGKPIHVPNSEVNRWIEGLQDESRICLVHRAHQNFCRQAVCGKNGTPFRFKYTLDSICPRAKGRANSCKSNA